MKKFLLAVVFLFWSLNSQSREWTNDEKLWATASTAVIVADWATTRDLTRRYNQDYYEHNPLLGKYPSTGRVDAYFALAVPINLLIADQLDDYRKHWLIGVTAVEAVLVGHNLHIGLKLQF